MKRNKKIIALVAILLFSILFSMLVKWIQTGDPFTAETILYGMVILFNILITGSIGYGIFRKLSTRRSRQLKRSILPAFFLFVLLALIVSLLIVSAGVYLFFLMKGYDTTNFIDQLLKQELPGAVKQFSIVIIAGSLVFFYSIWRRAMDREQQLQQENLSYRYRTLKSQVNPHFLFNSLNTLSELVYDDARKADAYIQKLSGIYRYVLENEENDLISLEEELEFIQHYFDLQKVRDQDKIFMEIDVQGAEEYQVIPVSLQLLVENALKHNSMSREKPLLLTIAGTADHVIVSNAIQRKNILENSTRKGLSNLKERVRLITGRELIVYEDGNQFVVKLPIIRQPK